MSTSQEAEVLEKEGVIEVLVPEGVNVYMRDGKLVAKGPMGECAKDFSRIPVELRLEDGKVVIKPLLKKRRGYAVLKTSASHVRNLLLGVLRGYVYKLKIAYAHFPLSVKVKGGEVVIENFLGERAPRRARIVGSLTKVRVEGDDVIVEGPCLEEVSQTAANIELATKIKEKDPRVFLDGVYVYERKLPARQ